MKSSRKIGRQVWNIRISQKVQWKVWKVTETVWEKSEKVVKVEESVEKSKVMNH